MKPHTKVLFFSMWSDTQNSYYSVKSDNDCNVKFDVTGAPLMESQVEWKLGRLVCRIKLAKASV